MTAAVSPLRRLSRAFSMGAGLAFVRLSCSFISIKITAIYLGPAGLALVAQFTNFVSLWQSVLGTGLNTAVVRLSSEYGLGTERRHRLLSTALIVAAVSTAVLALILILVSPWLSNWLLTDKKYTWAIVIAGLAIAAMVFNDLFQGALNAGREVGLLVLSASIAAVVGLLIFVPAASTWGLSGGVFGSFLVYIATVGITMVLLWRKSTTLKFKDFFGPFDKVECKRIVGFYPMLIVSSTLAPLILILVRDTLVSELSLASAGIWQATWRLSEAYQMVITSSLSLYFMTRLGEVVNDPRRLHREIWRTLGAAMGITVVLALGIFILREQVVHIIFSREFLPVQDLLPLQLVGDVFKMGAWIFSMVLISLVRSRAYIALSVIAPLLFAGGTKWLVPSIGIDGVMWAYVAASVAHFVLAAFALQDVLIKPKVWPAEDPAKSAATKAAGSVSGAAAGTAASAADKTGS
ncbi:N/A [soil metagenome]